MYFKTHWSPIIFYSFFYEKKKELDMYGLLQDAVCVVSFLRQSSFTFRNIQMWGLNKKKKSLSLQFFFRNCKVEVDSNIKLSAYQYQAINKGH